MHFADQRKGDRETKRALPPPHTRRRTSGASAAYEREERSGRRTGAGAPGDRERSGAAPEDEERRWGAGAVGAPGDEGVGRRRVREAWGPDRRDQASSSR